MFWLRQGVEGEEEQWVVVNLAVQRKWRVILPERFLLKAVHGGFLYGVARDELDVPSVGRLVNPVEAEPVREPG